MADERGGDVDQRRINDLLRRLALGLGVYRLFPGDLEQPAFQSVAERIREAARDALTGGPVALEVFGGQFVGPTAEILAGDEAVEKLARSLYERGAELVRFTGVPDTHDLEIFFAALSRPREEGGPGVGLTLLGAGITNITVFDLTPSGEEEARELDPEQQELWDQLGDAAGFAASLLMEGLPGPRAADQAEGLLRKFQSIAAVLPEWLTESPELYQRLRAVMGELPAPLRRAFTALAVARAGSGGVAERYVGTMTDADLAHSIVELGEEGADPVEVARRLVGTGQRREDLLQLTEALEGGSIDGRTILAPLGAPAAHGEGGGPTGAPGVAREGRREGGAHGTARGTTRGGGLDEESGAGDSGGTGAGAGDTATGAEEGLLGSGERSDAAVSESVSEIMGRTLLDTAQQDVSSVRQLFPETEGDRRTLALVAIRDYMRLEHDLERLAQVLEVWADEVRVTVAARDRSMLGRLLGIGETARDDHARSRVLDAHRDRVLTPQVVAELVHTPQMEADELRALLEPFGGSAVDRLFDVLAEEGDRRHRLQLIGLLAEMGAGHIGRIARRLDDERWFVVRNAVTILQRIGGPGTVTHVTQACAHAEPAVRREALRALVAVAGAEAVPQLHRMTGDLDGSVRIAALAALGSLVADQAAVALASVARSDHDVAERRRALDELAGHPSERSGELLEELTSRSGGLSWGLRRHAKRAVRSRAAGARGTREEPA